MNQLFEPMLLSFRDTYNETKEVVNKLQDLSDNGFASFEKDVDDSMSKFRTNRYLFLILLCLFFIVTSPYVILGLNNSLGSIVDYLLKNKNYYSEDYFLAINASLGLGAFAIISYLFIPPEWIIPSKLIPSLFYGINKKQSSYIISCVLGGYIALGLGLFLIQFNFTDYTSIAATIFKYYLLVPLMIIVMITMIVALMAVLKIAIGKYLSDDYYVSTQIKLSTSLLDGLHLIRSDSDLSQISIVQYEGIIEYIQEASMILRNYYGKERKYASQNMIVKLEKSANFLDQIVIDIQTGRKELEAIKDDIAGFLNIVLSGNLNQLPESESGRDYVEIAKKPKGYHYMLLGLYLVAPIILMSILTVFFNIQLTEYSHSLLKILYICWAFVGVFSNPIILNSESKDFIKDILKSWMGKG